MRTSSSSSTQCPARIEHLGDAGVVIGESILEPVPRRVVRCLPIAKHGQQAIEILCPGRIGRDRGDQAEPRIGERARRPVGLDRRRDRVQQLRRLFGERAVGSDQLAEAPDRATDVIADVRLIGPLAVPRHEVSHPPLPIRGCGTEERQHAADGDVPDVLAGLDPESVDDRQQTSGVVDAVAVLCAGHVVVGVLQYRGVITQQAEVAGARMQRRRRQRRHARHARQFDHRAANGGRENGLQRLADLRPLHRFGRFAGRRARSRAGLIVEQRVERVGE